MVRCHKPSIIIIRPPVQDASSGRDRIANLIVENSVESNYGAGRLAAPILTPSREGNRTLRKQRDSDVAATMLGKKMATQVLLVS